MRKLLLQHNRAPGDIIVMSALVRDIAATQPNIQISVNTSVGEIWRHNPHVTTIPKGTPQENLETIKLDYGPAIQRVGNRNQHFLTGFYENFEEQTKIHIPLRYPRPDYHLSAEERNVPLVSGRYWVVLSGGKSDFTTKHWIYKRAQQVVNLLKTAGVYTVQLGGIQQTGAGK